MAEVAEVQEVTVQALNMVKVVKDGELQMVNGILGGLIQIMMQVEDTLQEVVLAALMPVMPWTMIFGVVMAEVADLETQEEIVPRMFSLAKMVWQILAVGGLELVIP
tara:strand:+ start:303 stop:623 length:321 start_codon:yes stop_codon:yes gene_type:complete